MVFAIRQHESAIVYMCLLPRDPPPTSPPPPFQVVTEYLLWVPSKLPVALCFMYGTVYVLINNN